MYKITIKAHNHPTNYYPVIVGVTSTLKLYMYMTKLAKHLYYTYGVHGAKMTRMDDNNLSIRDSNGMLIITVEVSEDD